MPSDQHEPARCIWVNEDEALFLNRESLRERWENSPADATEAVRAAIDDCNYGAPGSGPDELTADVLRALGYPSRASGDTHHAD